MIHNFTLIALGIMLIGGCQKKSENLNASYVLPYGQEIQGSGFTMSLDSVYNDSRCPLTVICVWEGEVNGDLFIKKGNQDTLLPFTIRGLCDGSQMTCGDTIQLFGSTFIFKGILPYPDTTIAIPLSNYSLLLDINN